MDKRMWKTMTSVYAVSGAESALSAYLAEKMMPYCTTIELDAMGNLICTRKGTGREGGCLMLSAPMDVPGVIVHYIEENGMLRISPVGAFDAVSAVFGQVVFENGVKGIFCSDSGKADGATVRTCYIDIGAKDRKTASRRVRVGMTATIISQPLSLSADTVTGAFVGARTACAVLLETAKHLPETKQDVLFVFTAQSAVGNRGISSAVSHTGPDAVISLDAVPAGDCPGGEQNGVSLGDGAVIRVRDGGMASDARLLSTLTDCAVAQKIPCRPVVLTKEKTDAALAQMTAGGCRSISLGVPVRHLHTPAETVCVSDADALLHLLVSYVSDLPEDER